MDAARASDLATATALVLSKGLRITVAKSCRHRETAAFTCVVILSVPQASRAPALEHDAIKSKGNHASLQERYQECDPTLLSSDSR
jgi:hypothetical protein